MSKDEKKRNKRLESDIAFKRKRVMSKTFGEVPDIESRKVISYKWETLDHLWRWVAWEIERTNRLKGWINVRKRQAGEHIALIHSEVSEALEALREGDTLSEKPTLAEAGITKGMEEFADVIIRLADAAITFDWNDKLMLALRLKMEYNKTRPYRHGGKKF